MRPTFYVDLDCCIQSANAPKDRPHAFKPGDVLWITEAFPYAYGTIPAHTRFFVSHVADDDGTLWLLAEGDVPALFHEDNMVVLVPWDTEDILPFMRACVRVPDFQVEHCGSPNVTRLPPSNVRQLGKLAVVAAAVALALSMLPQRLTSSQLFTNATELHAHWNITHGNRLTIST